MNGKGVGSGPKSSHPTVLTQGGGEGTRYFCRVLSLLVERARAGEDG